MKKNDLDILKHNLPRIAGIYGKSDFFNSAVLIALVMMNDEYHFLFEKRANHIRQGGEICFPGGEHDPQRDRNYEETAIRETVEELGIAREKIHITGMLDTIIASVGATIDSFVGILDISSLDELAINRDEVEDVFVLPVSYFEYMEPEKYQIRSEVQPSYVDENNQEVVLLPSKELGLPKRYHKPWGRIQYNVLVYRTDHGIIWGITAALVHEIVQRLKPQ